MSQPPFSLSQGLHSRSSLVRKGCALALRAPKQLAWLRAGDVDYASRPPVLANSFPKSGTHLLDQLVEALPGRRNFGTFLASLTGSYQYRLRTEDETCRIIHRLVPGEIVRGHLFHAPATAQVLRQRRVVHYFIYRDPRDVVLSEAHYLRSINRWHKLHPHFRDLPSLDDAVALAIAGLGSAAPPAGYGNVTERFASFEGWLHEPDVCPVKFEELLCSQNDDAFRRIAEFYRQRVPSAPDADVLVERMRGNVAPERSHTFRKGRSGGWQESFTPSHRELFKNVAGDLLVRLGYEKTYDW